MDKLDLTSPDLTARNIDAVAELFPGVVTETRDADGAVRRGIDFDLLRQELSDHVVAGPQERFRLDWPGKRAALLAANAPIRKTLRPAREESVDFDTTKNIFIEGDNLEALKLLQESYLGKVKLIYIDPPYNTGNDFIYNDDFAQSEADYLVSSGQTDSSKVGLTANRETNGRFHSDWLSMIYPRLKLARRLLSDSGLVFLSIDDHELGPLLDLLDQVFGADNFISLLPRLTKRGGKSGALIASNHDYLVVYGRSEQVSLNRRAHTDAGFRHEDEYVDERGKYKLNQTLDYASIQYSRSLDYEIEIDGQIYRPGGATKEEMRKRQGRNPKTAFCWRWSPKLVEFGLRNGFLVAKPGESGGRLYTKTYSEAAIERSGGSYRVVRQERTKAHSSLSFVDNSFSNDNSKRGVVDLFSRPVFDYAKPVELMRELTQMTTGSDNEPVIMDFFAGSGTLGQAVMDANAEDGGSRRFIMVQLPEPIDPTSEAGDAGFRTIFELARDRLRRSGLKHPGSAVDVGFRVLRVDSSNMVDVLRVPTETEQGQLDVLTESTKPDRTGEDLLFQVLLDWGLELSLPIAREAVDHREVFVVDDGALIACFAEYVSPAVVREIAARQPLRAVFRDSGFASDAERINAEQIFKQVSPATDVKTI